MKQAYDTIMSAGQQAARAPEELRSPSRLRKLRGCHEAQPSGMSNLAGFMSRMAAGLIA